MACSNQNCYNTTNIQKLLTILLHTQYDSTAWVKSVHWDFSVQESTFLDNDCSRKKTGTAIHLTCTEQESAPAALTVVVLYETPPQQ